MGGGLMQLVAYGAQDVYLTGNPQITFFKVVYRRHTNFAMESIEQTFNGTANFGQRVSCTVSRNGDLCSRMYLEVDMPASAADTNSWVDSLGHALIKSVEVEIGGQRIDKQYGHWMEAWDELTCPAEKLRARSSMIRKEAASAGTGVATTTGTAVKLYIPLQFWFCRNPGLALPLIALQYHEVKVIVEFNSLASVAGASAVSSGDLSAKLWCDYIYLDTDERRRFAQVSHEYLIEQVQFTGDETISSGANKLRLNFNHPVKELVWCVLTSADTTASSNSAEGGVAMNGVTTDAKLLLNGHDRFQQRPGSYFHDVQPYQHHTRMPGRAGVYSYSFALKPEEHQPSGTCNFSRIDNATLSLTTGATGVAKVFAVNYNVLRIMSGMGGLAYSN